MSDESAKQFVKGTIYVVEDEASWMMGNLAEYHSTFPRNIDGEPLHNMIFKDRCGDIEMTIRLTNEVFSVAPPGSQLGDRVDLRAAGITVKGEGDDTQPKNPS